MRYREKLNIILMRDNGPRRSLQLRRSNFLLLACFFCCLPFLCLYLAGQCWRLWQENHALQTAVAQLATEMRGVQNRAARLENLEALLQEENVPAREAIIRQISAMPTEKEPQLPEPDSTAALAIADGPGHEDFPALDEGRVIVNNVQVRALGDRSVRIGLDLRNPDNEPSLSGEVSATLITARGEKVPLKFPREDSGAFRISRFKRTVIMASLPRNIDLQNAQLILEVRDLNDKPIFRNIFGVQI